MSAATVSHSEDATKATIAAIAAAVEGTASTPDTKTKDPTVKPAVVVSKPIPTLAPPPKETDDDKVATTAKPEVQRMCMMCRKPLVGPLITYPCKCKTPCVVHADCAPCPMDMAKMVQLQVQRKAKALASELASRHIYEQKQEELNRKQRDRAREHNAGITAEALFNFRQAPLSENDVTTHFQKQPTLPAPIHPVTPAGNMILAPKVPASRR